MNEPQARDMVRELHDRHPKWDLLVESADRDTGDPVWVPSYIGRQAVAKMKDYDIELFREAAAEAEMETPKFFNIACIFAKANDLRARRVRVAGSSITTLLVPYDHMTVVYHRKHKWFGWVDNKRKPPSIWWVIPVPHSDQYVAFPCQYFEQSGFAGIEPAKDPGATKKSWGELRERGLLRDTVGLDDLLATIECISPTTGAKYVPGSAIGETPEGERLF